MEENFDIFNLPADAFITPEKKTTSEFYSPSADKGRDGVYKALIRFLPNVHNPVHSKIMKYYVWLEDPTTNEGFSVDCPSTVGKPSILKDMYWKLKNSESVRDQELAQEAFGRVESHYALVQIIKDQNQPELEGKIMIYKFGAKINQKIEAQLKPEFGAPVNPFDLFNGRVFSLHIVKKMKWNNYDQCEFVGDRTPIELDGKPIQQTKEDMERVTKWLKEESTDISKYAYKEWDEEMTNKVHSIIKKIVPDGRLVEEISNSAKAEGTKAASKEKESMGMPQTSFSEPEAYSEPESKPSSGAVSSIDDLYDDL
jgi:hypothetical protein